MPLAGTATHGVLVGKFAHFVETLHAFAHAVIIDGKDVGASEAEEKHHLDGPASDATHLGDTLDDLLIFHAGEGALVGNSGVEALGGEVAQGEEFVLRQAGGTKRGLLHGEKVFGRHAALGEEPLDASHDGRGGGSSELLIDDGAGQREEDAELMRYLHGAGT